MLCLFVMMIVMMRIVIVIVVALSMDFVSKSDYAKWPCFFSGNF